MADNEHLEHGFTRINYCNNETNTMDIDSNAPEEQVTIQAAVRESGSNFYQGGPVT